MLLPHFLAPVYKIVFMRTWPNSFTKMTVETDLSGPPWKAGLPGGSVTKNLPASARDPLRSLDQEDPPGEGNGNPLQYSWLRNPTDRGCWWAMVHGFAKSWTWLRDWRLGTPRKACVCTHACVCVCVCVCVCQCQNEGFRVSWVELPGFSQQESP